MWKLFQCTPHKHYTVLTIRPYITTLTTNYRAKQQYSLYKSITNKNCHTIYITYTLTLCHKCERSTKSSLIPGNNSNYSAQSETVIVKTLLLPWHETSQYLSHVNTKTGAKEIILQQNRQSIWRQSENNHKQSSDTNKLAEVE